MKDVVSEEVADSYAERAIAGETHAHSDLMWEIRCIPRIIEYFKGLWNCDDLIVGYDGIGAGKTNPLRWHTDQTFSSRQPVCFQAVLALTDAESTQFVPMSHKTHHMRVGDEYDGEWQFQHIDVTNEESVETPKLKKVTCWCGTLEQHTGSLKVTKRE